MKQPVNNDNSQAAFVSLVAAAGRDEGLIPSNEPGVCAPTSAGVDGGEWMLRGGVRVNAAGPASRRSVRTGTSSSPLALARFSMTGEFELELAPELICRSSEAADSSSRVQFTTGDCFAAVLALTLECVRVDVWSDEHTARGCALVGDGGWAAP